MTHFAQCFERPSISSSSQVQVSVQHRVCSLPFRFTPFASWAQDRKRHSHIPWKRWSLAHLRERRRYFIEVRLTVVGRQDAIKLASPEAFADNPSRVWQFYHYRREVYVDREHTYICMPHILAFPSARAAVPNAAHKAIALLSTSPEELARVAPCAQTFRLITQNVDNLSIRALPSSTPISAYPIEMHGNIFRVMCTECDLVALNFDSPICQGIAGTEALFKDGEPEPQIELEDLPRCQECGALLRPGVVWFGEAVEHLDEINEMVEELCDLILVVGTSSTVGPHFLVCRSSGVDRLRHIQVMPAGMFADMVKDHDGKVAVFNIEKTWADDEVDFEFVGPCEETLPRALDVVDRLVPSGC